MSAPSSCTSNDYNLMLETASKNYLIFKDYVEKKCANYISNMAAMLGLKIAGKDLVRDWARLVDIGDDYAKKSWAFTVEYAPTVLERGENKVFSRKMLEGLRALGWNDSVLVGTTDSKGTLTTFKTLDRAFNTVFQSKRESWRRVGRGTARKPKCRMCITKPGSSGGKDRPPALFYYCKRSIELGKVREKRSNGGKVSGFWFSY